MPKITLNMFSNPDAQPLILSSQPIKSIYIPIATPSVPQPVTLAAGIINNLNTSPRFKNRPAGLATEEIISKEDKDQSLANFIKTHCVALLDTGVNAKHPDLLHSKITLVSANGNEEDFDDQFGHGTHIAGLISADGEKVRGVVPHAPIISYKITSQQSSESRWTAITDALQRVIDHNNSDNVCKVSVVNLSFNGLDNMTNDENAREHRLYALISTLYDMQVPVVVSGGNNFSQFLPRDTTSKTNPYGLAYPANFDTVIACGAACTNNCFDNRTGYEMDEKELAPFSQRPLNIDEKKLFITVPAVETVSTGLNGAYTTLTGSSMAAPYVTGAIFLIQYGFWKSHPFANEIEAMPSVDQIKKALREGCDMLDNTGTSPFSQQINNHPELRFYKQDYLHLNVKSIFNKFKQTQQSHGHQ